MMSPSERQALFLNAGGKTTLDAQLDAVLDTGDRVAQIGAMQGAAATRDAAILAELQKHTALLKEIRDQLKKGLLVKTVVTL